MTHHKQTQTHTTSQGGKGATTPSRPNPEPHHPWTGKQPTTTPHHSRGNPWRGGGRPHFCMIPFRLCCGVFRELGLLKVPPSLWCCVVRGLGLYICVCHVDSCMYSCVCVYMYICMYACMYADNIRIYVCMYASMHELSVCLSVCPSVCLAVCMDGRMDGCMKG